ncbi:MAG: D-alanyl-D-alanine carboxypeptidase family protein [candidate division NC10 bacterium]|nr:D-alanyl-D-alanine carboxypeptidase family protein [candidate division NC10 bacterium]
MTRRSVGILLILVAAGLLIWTASGLGEQVIFKNGSTLQAKVLESSGSEFMEVEVEGGIIGIPWREVDRVIPDLKEGAFPPLPPQINAASALLIEEGSGRVLLEKNARERRPIASLTKLMTAVIVLERGNLGEVVRVSKRAAATPGASLRLRAGQRIRLRDLLVGLLVRSANDAAVAAAEHVCGSEEEFVRAMNEKARSLGLFDTQFRNCHGLHHPDHYSSAYDLAVLSRYAMSLPFFAECVRNREASIFVGGIGRPRVFKNSNKFLKLYLGADGIKTGYTEVAGRCLVASALRGERRLIAVLLNDEERWRDACELLEYGFFVFFWQQLQGLNPPGRSRPEDAASEG